MLITVPPYHHMINWIPKLQKETGKANKTGKGRGQGDCGRVGGITNGLGIALGTTLSTSAAVVGVAWGVSIRVVVVVVGVAWVVSVRAVVVLVDTIGITTGVGVVGVITIGIVTTGVVARWWVCRGGA